MGIRIKARTAVPTWVANLFGFDGHMTLHEGIISCDDLQCHPEAFNPAVTMTGKRDSCMICIQIRRVPTDGADTYFDDARFLEFDIHYQNNKDGTEIEYPS